MADTRKTDQLGAMQVYRGSDGDVICIPKHSTRIAYKGDAMPPFIHYGGLVYVKINGVYYDVDEV